MRNIKTVKGIPSPIKTAGAYRSETLECISFVNSEGNTVLTMQDKNFGATKVCTKFYLGSDSRNFDSDMIGTTFFPTSTQTVEEQLIAQGLLPSGMHVYSKADRDIKNTVENSRYFAFTMGTLAPFTLHSVNYTLSELQSLNYVEGYASGSALFRAWLYLYGSTRPFSIRLVYDSTIIPVKDGTRKKIKLGSAPSASAYVDGEYSLIDE